MISFVTVTQGNPKALRRTIDNLKSAFGGMVNEFMVGDVSVHLDNFSSGFGEVRFVHLPFNALLKDGFAHTLNRVAAHATNNLCLYLNVGEVVDGSVNTSLIHEQYNCYPFNHATDPHIWVRLWDQRELEWSGRIHEIIIGPKRQCPHIIFQMADLPKDDDDDFKSAIYNDIKEMVYFHQYVHIVRHPEDLGGTDQGWLGYSTSEYDDLVRRLGGKGERYQAFLDGDLERYLKLAESDNLSKIWSKP